MTLWPDRPTKGLDAVNCDAWHGMPCVRLLTSPTSKPPLPKPRCQRRAVVVLCPRLAGDYQGSLLDLTTFVSVIHGFLDVGFCDEGPFIPPCRGFQSPKSAKGPCQASIVFRAKQVVVWPDLARLAESSFGERDTVTMDGSLVGNHR